MSAGCDQGFHGFPGDTRDVVESRSEKGKAQSNCMVALYDLCPVTLCKH